MNTPIRYPAIISAVEFNAIRDLSKADRALHKAAAAREVAADGLASAEVADAIQAAIEAGSAFITHEEIALATFADVALGADSFPEIYQ